MAVSDSSVCACVYNPINAKFFHHTHTSSYNCICLPFCSCFGDLQDYFSTGTTLHPQQLLHPGSTVAMAISVAWKKTRLSERGRSQKEKKKEKSIQSWQENNWFHYIRPADSLYHQWQGDDKQQWKGLYLCLNSNKLLLGSGLHRPYSLIKWDQTYIPLTSSSLLLKNLKV